MMVPTPLGSAHLPMEHTRVCCLPVDIITLLCHCEYPQKDTSLVRRMVLLCVAWHVTCNYSLQWVSNQLLTLVHNFLGPSSRAFCASDHGCHCTTERNSCEHHIKTILLALSLARWAGLTWYPCGISWPPSLQHI